MVSDGLVLDFVQCSLDPESSPNPVGAREPPDGPLAAPAQDAREEIGQCVKCDSASDNAAEI